MKITNVRGGLYVPDFKDGDKFYVIAKGEITAVKIKDSYLTISFGNNNVFVKGEFVTPKGEWGEGYITISKDLMKTKLNFEIYNNERPFGTGIIYKTIEDARNNKPYNGFINLACMEILNKGEHVNINDSSFSLFYWTYYASENKPIKKEINFYSLIRVNNELKISKKNEPMKLNYWASEEECQNAINARLLKANVCDFDEDKEPTIKINLSVEVNMNASEEEIVSSILKTLHKER